MSINSKDFIFDLINGRIRLNEVTETPLFMAAFKQNKFDNLSTYMDIPPLCFVIDKEILSDPIALKLDKSQLFDDLKLSKLVNEKLVEYSSLTNSGEMIPALWTQRAKGAGVFTDEDKAWEHYYYEHRYLIELEDSLKENLIKINQAKDYLKMKEGLK